MIFTSSPLELRMLMKFTEDFLDFDCILFVKLVILFFPLIESNIFGS